MSKSDKLRVRDYLAHILEAIERIHRYVEEISEDEFLQDEKSQDAVIRNFEIIGEASRNIERYHSDFTALHPEVPWTEIYLMRNRLAHGYFSIDTEIVWKTIQDDLPHLSAQIQELLNIA